MSKSRDGDGAADRVAPEFVRRCEAGEFSFALPGEGGTKVRIAQLRELGRGDLALARLGEGHADALAILHEAGVDPPDEARLGVWAAGPVEELRATPTTAGWCLEGRRRWCSGAMLLTHGLVTASAPDGDRLFLVATTRPGFEPDPSSWPAVGMAGSGTFDVAFHEVTLQRTAAIDRPGFYLHRPGFWVGAVGVAAVWLGAAEAVAGTLARGTGDDPHALAHLGAVHARLESVSALLDHVADVIEQRFAKDARRSAGGPEDLELLARSLRAEVEAAATEILERTGRATGAAPLGHDAAHARRVADLTVYLRQSHGERDLEALGALSLRLDRADPTRS